MQKECNKQKKHKKTHHQYQRRKFIYIFFFVMNLFAYVKQTWNLQYLAVQSHIVTWSQRIRRRNCSALSVVCVFFFVWIIFNARIFQNNHFSCAQIIRTEWVPTNNRLHLLSFFYFFTEEKKNNEFFEIMR